MKLPVYTTGLRMITSGLNVQNFHSFGMPIDNEFNQILINGLRPSSNFNISESFKRESYKLFNEIAILDTIQDINERDKWAQLSNRYFENFTFTTENLLRNNQPILALNVWQKIIDMTKKWEKENQGKTIHKGTPYYFMAVAVLSVRDFDTALITMHIALQEDKRNAQNYKRTPAYYFLTLDDRVSDQYLKQYVDYMIGFLRDRLDGRGNGRGRYKGHYHATRNGSLTYEQLREKFLDNESINEEIKYFFVYSTIKCWHLRVNQNFNREEKIIAPIIFAHALGPFPITIETLLKIKYPRPQNHNESWNFGNVFQKLASAERWQIDNLGNINYKRDKNFSNWIDECLNKKSLTGDFTLTYGLRNFIFHEIKSQQKLWEEFTDVLQSVWNCFFKTIEAL